MDSRYRPISKFCIPAMTGLILLVFLITGCTSSAQAPPEGYPKPYRVGRNWYQPLPHAKGFSQRGVASWYGRKFHGRKTSNGETYDMFAMTAAHKTLPFNTRVKVHNLSNNRVIYVRINDRGPFVKGRIIDLSYTAAKKIGMVGPGTARVEVTAMGIRTASGRAGTANGRPVDYFSGNFTIQVGAFGNRENAEKLRDQLDRRYKNAHISPYTRGNQTLYRVRVGHCTTLTQAIEYEKILIENGHKGAFVVAE